MKWTPADIEKFEKSPEYVDTAVVPLFPISFANGMKETASMTEFTGLLTSQLERQLQGRILLIPGFSYLKDSRLDVVEQLKLWETELLDKQFNHVFYVTSDYDWKQQEAEFQGTLLWIPSLPLQHMDEKARQSVMEDQIRQLMNLFIQKWRDAETE
jgi:hypothetical protein